MGYPRKPSALPGLTGMGGLIAAAIARAIARKPQLNPRKKGKPRRLPYPKPPPPALEAKATPSTGQGSGVKSSFVESHKLKGSKRVLASLTPTNFYQYNNAWRIAANAGLQTANSSLFFSQPDLLQQFAQFGGTANSSKQMLVKSLFADYTVTNQTSAPVYLTVYDIGFKREMDTTDTQTWAPELAWNNGEIQEGNAIGASMIGSDPKKVSLFKEYYIVKKKSNHFMAPGEVHKHTVMIRPNKFITKNRVSDSIRYAGLSYATMFVTKGTPVDTVGSTTFDVGGAPAFTVPFESYYDSSGNPIAPPLTAGQAVTTGPVLLDVVATWKYGFQWAADVDADITAVNNISTIPIGAINLEYMNRLGYISTVGVA